MKMTHLLDPTSLMITSSCNAQRQIHECSQKQHVGASAKKIIVNMPYQWHSNFHRDFCNVISLKCQFSYVLPVSVPIAQYQIYKRVDAAYHQDNGFEEPIRWWI